MLPLSIVAAAALSATAWADYSGPLRPQLHFSPEEGFMNDPNGMFLDDDGTWHLYYQCMRAMPFRKLTIFCRSLLTLNQITQPM